MPKWEPEHSHIRVKGCGPMDATILLVGEAPGVSEALLGQPFVGLSGQRLFGGGKERGWVNEVGLHRGQFRIENVCEYCPPHTIADRWDKDTWLQWMEDLHERIARLDHLTLIIPTGNYALYALTGKGKVHWHTRDGKESRPGILDWRGSLLSYTDRRGRRRKVIPTPHPAATFPGRDPGLEPVCKRDWKRIAAEAGSAELNIPVRTHIINPTQGDLDLLVRTCEAMGDDEVVALDIENPMEKGGGAPIVCVGFAPTPQLSITVPTSKKSTREWEVIEHVLSLPVAKVAHNNFHEAYWLWAEREIEVVGMWWDTMYMHHCLTGDTKILMDDCKWKELRHVAVGEHIYAFDEFPTNGRYRRHLRRARVTARSTKQASVYLIRFDDGTHLRATADHKILVGLYDRHPMRRAGNHWCEVRDLKFGDEVYSIGKPWDNYQTPESYWLAGIYDGEGSLGVRKWGSDERDLTAHVSFTQKPGIIMQRVVALLTNLGFDTRQDSSTRADNLHIRGGLSATLRFLGCIPAIRLHAKFKKIAEGNGWNGFTGLRGAKVISIEKQGREQVYDISTTQGTFIANGIVVHNCLDPAAPHSLDFCASVDTREPFWKHEAKDPEDQRKYTSNLAAFYTYNGKDCCVTRELFDVYYQRLLEEVRRTSYGVIDGVEFYLRHYAELYQPLLGLMRAGVRVDESRRAERYAELVAQVGDLKGRLVEQGIDIYSVGKTAKGGISRQKLAKYLYEELGLPKQYVRNKKKGEKTVTTNEVAIRTLAEKHPDKLGQVAPLILDQTRLKKLSEFYTEGRVDEDGYFRSSYGLNTEAGRLQSKKAPNGSGSNAQNIDREARDMFLADPGHIGVEVDLSQAEARIVYLAIYKLTGDKDMLNKARLRPTEYDQHTEMAAKIFGFELEQYKAMKKTDPEQFKLYRYLGKTTVHAAQREQSGKGLSERLAKDGYFYAINECEGFIRAYRRAVPGLEDYFRDVRRRIMQDHYLLTDWGRILRFDYARLDDSLYRAGYSFDPQANVADHMNQKGLKPLAAWFEREQCGRINVHAHDALFFSVLPERAWDATKFLIDSLESPFTYHGTSLCMPCEVKVGLSWKGTSSWGQLPEQSTFEEAVYELTTRHDFDGAQWRIGDRRAS